MSQGVEEAIHCRKPEAVREEQEEQLAAEEERKSRQCTLSQSSAEAPKRIKILMLGDSGVGKSSLIIRWTQDSFSTDLVGTVGVNFKTRRVVLGADTVQVQVWDTAGQEQFHKITTSYYKGANGIMLVYDVSDKKSVENVEYWVKKIRSNASDSVHVALIGNKVDLRAVCAEKCVDASHGQAFSSAFSVPYFETSAKDATNVEDAFHCLIEQIMASEGGGGGTTAGGGGGGGSGGSGDHKAGGGSQTKKFVDKEGKGKNKGEKCLLS